MYRIFLALIFIVIPITATAKGKPSFEYRIHLPSGEERKVPVKEDEVFSVKTTLDNWVCVGATETKKAFIQLTCTHDGKSGATVIVACEKNSAKVTFMKLQEDMEKDDASTVGIGCID